MTPEIQNALSTTSDPAVESSALFGIGGRDKAYPNRKLLPGEIARTEQEYKPWKKHSPLGNTHPNTCGMTQCRYCYNEDTQRIIHPYDLQPFVAYYGDKNFQVYSCYLCGGLWHWEMPND